MRVVRDMADPNPSNDYLQELLHQRKAWDRKASLRAIYHLWYQRIVESLAPLVPTVEIGSGCGNFKTYYPRAVATDVVRAHESIDRIVDARDLPFGERQVGNFVLIDVLHHLSRPLQFLRSAQKALAPQGRIVILEPAGTPFARLIWKCCHHEPFDARQDLFGEAWQTWPCEDREAFSNMAIATILFRDRREETLKCLPELSLRSMEYSDFVVWPATGGFSYFGFMPACLVSPLHRLEHCLTSWCASKLTGLRVLIVLEKRPEAP
ncbi:MAG: methyltransferase domain-containing protein [Phycisphaerae bacterium]|nr:methyltransferase domain-containing protein [Phycisphaerae bacterium]